MTAPEWPPDTDTPIYDRLIDEITNANATSTEAVLDSERPTP